MVLDSVVFVSQAGCTPAYEQSLSNPRQSMNQYTHTNTVYYKSCHGSSTPAAINQLVIQSLYHTRTLHTYVCLYFSKVRFDASME